MAETGTLRAAYATSGELPNIESRFSGIAWSAIIGGASPTAGWSSARSGVSESNSAAAAASDRARPGSGRCALFCALHVILLSFRSLLCRGFAWNAVADDLHILADRPGGLDDLDGVVAFLLSDDAKFITAQTLAVDGGFSMH